MPVLADDIKVELQLDGNFRENVWTQEADWEEGRPTDADALSPDWDHTALEGVAGFDSETDADGDLNDSTANPKLGTTHIRVDFDDGNAAFGKILATSVDRTEATLHLYLDLTNYGGDGAVRLINFVDGGGQAQWALDFTQSGQIVSKARDDGGTISNQQVSSGLSDGYHHIRMVVKRATGAGNNDGIVALYIDGSHIGTTSDIDNDTVDWDEIRVGMNVTNSSTFGGFFDIDEIRVSESVSPVWITEAAALAGSYGAAFTIEDVSSRYVQLSNPTSETKVSVEFRLDPNGLTMATNDSFIIVDGTEARVNMTFDGTNHELQLRHSTDGAGEQTGSRIDITDEPHLVRVVWIASDGLDNGAMYLYVDGELKDELTGIDNDTKTVERVRFGPFAELDSGTSGVFFMDDMKWSDDAKAWMDVTPDVLKDEQFSWQYGMTSQIPSERAAGPGRLTFYLDNSARTNSGGVDGYYSPNHQDKRDGFMQGIGVRVGITYDSDTYYKFRGTLRDIKPDAGKFGRGRVRVEATDWLGEMVNHTPQQISLQTNQTGDQIVNTLLGAIDSQPPATSLSTGSSTFANALDDMDDGRTTAHQVLKNIAVSELSYIYQKGDTDTGGVLVFESRNDRINDTDEGFTLDDDADTDDMSELSALDTRRLIYNKITGTAFPRTIDSTANKVLWSLVGDAPTITPGETQIYIGKYTDSDNPDARVGGADVVTPVPTTDFQFSGADTDLTVDATLGSNSARLEVSLDSDASSGTIDKLQVRGKRVNVFQPVLAESTDSDSVASFGDRSLSMRFRYQEDALEVQDFIDTIKDSFKDPRLRAESVSFIANKSDFLMKKALQTEPGDKVKISESMTGFTGEGHYIHGVQQEVREARLIDTTWTLIPASAVTYWTLNTSALDTDTRLGF